MRLAISTGQLRCRCGVHGCGLETAVTWPRITTIWGLSEQRQLPAAVPLPLRLGDGVRDAGDGDGEVAFLGVALGADKPESFEDGAASSAAAADEAVEDQSSGRRHQPA